MSCLCHIGLPAGTYCNLIDDCKTSLQVGGDGKANVHIDNYEDPILAVCVGCDDGDTPTQPTSPTGDVGDNHFKRMV